jgi:methionine-rich copper-binding protein CopC
MNLRKIALAGGSLVAAIVIGAIASSAHAFPEREIPSAGEALSAPPSEVRIKFNAPIEHLFAQLHVLGADGNDVVAGSPEISDGGYTLMVKVRRLKQGDYTVKWSVVCIDTHHTQGSYSFSVSGQGS